MSNPNPKSFVQMGRAYTAAKEQDRAEMAKGLGRLLKMDASSAQDFIDKYQKSDLDSRVKMVGALEMMFEGKTPGTLPHLEKRWSAAKTDDERRAVEQETDAYFSEAGGSAE